jgi:hypothetical protein
MYKLTLVNGVATRLQQTNVTGTSSFSFNQPGYQAQAGSIWIGGESNISGMNGKMCEVIYYQSALSTVQQETIEGYLATKWGLSGSLPPAHPFYLKKFFPHYWINLMNLFGPTGVTGPVGTAANTGASGSTGCTGPPGPALVLASGNAPYQALTGLITTVINTTQTRIYEVGPISSNSTNKFLIITNVSLICNEYSIQMTVGRATTSGETASNSTNITSNEAPLILPSSTPSYYIAAHPGSSVTSGKPLSLNGSAIDEPGGGSFYYTLWISSDTQYDYADMTVNLYVVKVL